MKQRIVTAVLAAVGSLPAASPIAKSTLSSAAALPAPAPAPAQAPPSPAPAPAQVALPSEPAPLATLLHTHTGELLALSESAPSIEVFSTLLADHRLGRRTEIDPRLLEMLRAVARQHPGARIDIVSGYRSSKRNEMMRKKGRHVASHSQHTLGQAIDFRVEGLSPAKVVQVLDKLKWKGGIGRYDAKHDRFVHVDVGPPRRWLGR